MQQVSEIETKEIDYKNILLIRADQSTTLRILYDATNEFNGSLQDSSPVIRRCRTIWASW